jgi:peptidoglycan/xylan/chitin deacetylase (PgdA/CDA1 family)
LAAKGVKATFFVIGQGEEADLERMRRIVDEGHTIGMHSYTHDYNSVYSSVEGFLDEFYRIFCQIRETTGVTPTVFRCPGGSINGYDGGFYQEILSEMIRRGFAPYDWNVSSEDAATNQTLPVETLVSNVVNNSIGKVRSIVLFHDSGSKTTTAQAIGPVIDKLREQGFSFAPITPDTMPVLYNYTHIF